MFTRQQAIRGAQNFVLIFVSIGIVALYSSLNRPIWIDEMQHFAWGGIGSPGKATLDVITPVIEGTAASWYTSSWLYFLWDVFLLDWFGANSLALRAPSIISGLLFLLLAIWFIRAKKLRFIWQLGVLLALLAQSTAMYYVGEARPYMPLALCVLGLAFYFSSAPPARSTLAMRTLGWSSAIVGALLHTYALLYAGIFAVIFGVFWLNRSFTRRTLKDFFSCTDPALLITMAAIEVLTRWPSLMTASDRPRAWQGGPWEFVAPHELLELFVFSHFAFIPLFPWGLLVVALGIGVSLVVLLRGRWPREALDVISPPLLLTLCLLLVSVIVSLLSFSQGYWILSRHWSASIMLVAVAFIWLLGEITKVLSTQHARAGRALALGSVTVLILVAPLKVSEQTQALRSYQNVKAEYQTKWAGTSEREASSLWGVEDVQNINIYLGGKVWPINACFSPVWQNCP